MIAPVWYRIASRRHRRLVSYRIVSYVGPSPSYSPDRNRAGADPKSAKYWPAPRRNRSEIWPAPKICSHLGRAPHRNRGIRIRIAPHRNRCIMHNVYNVASAQSCPYLIESTAPHRNTGIRIRIAPHRNRGILHNVYNAASAQSCSYLIESTAPHRNRDPMGKCHVA